MNDVFDQADAVTIPSSHLAAELVFPRTPEGLASLTTQAGMQVQTATTLTWTWHVTPASLWVGISGGVATPGAWYQAQTPAGRRRIADAFDALSRDHAQDGLHFDCAAAYVLATR